jgi:hypothetical protein
MLRLGILLAGASAAPYHFVSAANGVHRRRRAPRCREAGLIAAGGALLAIGSGQVAATAADRARTHRTLVRHLARGRERRPARHLLS